MPPERRLDVGEVAGLLADLELSAEQWRRASLRMVELFAVVDEQPVEVVNEPGAPVTAVSSPGRGGPSSAASATAAVAAALAGLPPELAVPAGSHEAVARALAVALATVLRTALGRARAEEELVGFGLSVAAEDAEGGR